MIIFFIDNSQLWKTKILKFGSQIKRYIINLESCNVYESRAFGKKYIFHVGFDNFKAKLEADLIVET